MAFKGRPLWQEGMFLRPQHFQQYDRWVEHLVEARAAGLTPFSWGVRRIDIDHEALRAGQFRLLALEVVLPDGTVFSAPEAQPLPAARVLRPEDGGKRIFLAIPVKTPGAAEVSEAGERRFRSARLDVADNAQGGGSQIDIEVGALTARFVIEGETLDEFVSIPVAELAAPDAPNGKLLNDSFIPPLLDVAASPQLLAHMEHLRGLLHSRAETLAKGTFGERDGPRAALLDIVLLGVVNRYEAGFRHMIEMRRVTPERVYAACVEMIGELAAFGDGERRLPETVAYLHHDLRASFEGVVSVLRGLLSVIVHRPAFAVTLTARDYGIWLGTPGEKPLGGPGRLVLIVRADLGQEQVRRQFPGQVKIGPVEQIRDLVNLQLPGIPIAPLATAPREIPFVQDAVYFELESTNALWPRMKDSAAFALHVSGDYPGLSIELWVIERSSG